MLHCTNYFSLTIVLAIEQVGVETMDKDSKYVLFLDDDVSLHPGSIGALAREMERNPEVCLKNLKFGSAVISYSAQSAFWWPLDWKQTIPPKVTDMLTAWMHYIAERRQSEFENMCRIYLKYLWLFDYTIKLFLCSTDIYTNWISSWFTIWKFRELLHLWIPYGTHLPLDMSL